MSMSSQDGTGVYEVTVLETSFTSVIVAAMDEDEAMDIARMIVFEGEQATKPYFVRVEAQDAKQLGENMRRFTENVNE